MTAERIVRGVAGFFVLLSLVLACKFSDWWLLFTAFVGLNLFQSAFSDWCPALTMLRRMGFNGKKDKQV